MKKRKYTNQRDSKKTLHIAQGEYCSCGINIERYPDHIDEVNAVYQIDYGDTTLITNIKPKE